MVTQILKKFTVLLSNKSSFIYSIRHLSTKNMPLVKVLNVAEKNDAAKNIAQVLSNGRSQRVSS